MEKKRTGLRSYIRSNLPIELVNFLKKKGILTDFIQIFLNATSGYINQKEVFTRSLNVFPNGKVLFEFVKSADFGENKEYWNKLKLEYESECANSK